MNMSAVYTSKLSWIARVNKFGTNSSYKYSVSFLPDCQSDKSLLKITNLKFLNNEPYLVRQKKSATVYIASFFKSAPSSQKQWKMKAVPK